MVNTYGKYPICKFESLTITRVEDNTGGTTRGVEGEHGLDGDVHGRGVEGLEHDLKSRDERL